MYAQGATKLFCSGVAASSFEGGELDWKVGFLKILTSTDCGNDKGFAEEDASSPKLEVITEMKSFL